MSSSSLEIEVFFFLIPAGVLQAELRSQDARMHFSPYKMPATLDILGLQDTTDSRVLDQGVVGEGY